MVAYDNEIKPNKKTMLSELPIVSQGMILTAHIPDPGMGDS